MDLKHDREGLIAIKKDSYFRVARTTPTLVEFSLSLYWMKNLTDKKNFILYKFNQEENLSLEISGSAITEEGFRGKESLCSLRLKTFRLKLAFVVGFNAKAANYLANMSTDMANIEELNFQFKECHQIDAMTLKNVLK